MSALVRTMVWQDALAIPDVVTDVVEAPLLDADLVARVRTARRVIVTGNGAAYYAATVLQAAAFEVAGPAPCVAVPAGLLATRHLALQATDLLLVVSSSGELRDVVDLLPAGLPCPWALVTTTPGSTLGRAAPTSVVVPLRSQTAVTHSQAFLGNVVALLKLWREVAGLPDGLDLGVLADHCASALASAPAWADEVASTISGASSGIAFGSGGAWPAALETALLFKEVAGIPVEGLETREGATSGMYALGPGHVVLSHPTADDPHSAEAEEICGATGATVLRVPGCESLPSLAAAAVTFPAALALATSLGLTTGLDVDRPAWTSAYYATARSR